jgi:hypothetical protein
VFEEKNQQVLSGLDVRIFVVTIFLSVVLLSIAITELLCTFGVIQGLAEID